MSHKLGAERSLKTGHKSLYLRWGGWGFKIIAFAIFVLNEPTKDNSLSVVYSMSLLEKLLRLCRQVQGYPDFVFSHTKGQNIGRSVWWITDGHQVRPRGSVTSPQVLSFRKLVVSHLVLVLSNWIKVKLIKSLLRDGRTVFMIRVWN